MKKTIIIFLLFSYLLIISFSAQAKTIEEIFIVGLSRTDEDVVRNQLPFSERDEWKEEYRKWTLNRLRDMGVFSFQPQRIIVEDISADKLRVIIRLSDPSLFYIDPAEYAISNLTILPAKWFRQNIYNFSGNGERIWFNINWDNNYFYETGLTFPIKKGLSSLNIKSYRNERKTYLEKGYLVETDYNYWYNSKVFQQFKLAYQKGDFNYDEQKIIMPATSIFWQDTFSLGTIIQSGINLTEDNRFIKTEGVFHKRNLPWNMLLRGGMLSNNTPDNYHYYLGGVGKLPLRAEGYKKKATSYLLGSVEYYFEIKSSLTPIVFADGTVFKKDLDVDYKNILNVGFGLAYNTPLGIPFRFDYAYNPETTDSSLRFGFGHSSWFNRIN